MNTGKEMASASVLHAVILHHLLEGTMLMQGLVIISLLVAEIAGSAVRPVVSFLPNWDTIFTGESITLRCDMAFTAHRGTIFYWYKDNFSLHRKQQSLTISSATFMDRGDYQCQTGTSQRSESVRLSVSHGYVIVQKPPFVYEGDLLILRCHSFPGYKSKQTTFYKDDKSLQSLGDIYIGDCVTGTYMCSKYVYHDLLFYFHTAETYISVTELFSKPEIIANPQKITEGVDVMLTCSTSLSPARATTGLQFAFYRYGRTVQDFTFNRTFQLSPAQLEDSGDYTCEARTLSTTVRKMSGILEVFISELFPYLGIRVNTNSIIEGDALSIGCGIENYQSTDTLKLQFGFYKDKERVQLSLSNKYHVYSAQLMDSGNYFCEVKTLDNRNKKVSQEVNINIQELFATPVLNTSSFPIAEDSEMTLNCITQKRISQNTELQFAFYRNGEQVQNFSASNKYHILLAQPKDSGVYVCKVQTFNSSVKKISQELDIHVEENPQTYNLLIASMVLLTLLLIGFILVCNYKNKLLALLTACWTSHSQSRRGELHKEVDEKEVGELCYAQIDFTSNKDPPNKTTDTGVSYATLKTRLHQQIKAEQDFVYGNLNV